MNYLAHALLSGDDEEILFGNFIGDFIKGNQYEQFPEKVKKGILLHRLIDDFTDSHHEYLKGKRRFYEEYPKISGVIMDILLDHLLCKEWENHTEKELNQFITNTYAKIDSKVNDLPQKMLPLYSHMRTNDWFGRYQTEEGTMLSLSQIGRRIGFEKDVGNSIEIYRFHQEKFIDEFNLFFDDLREETALYLSKN